MWLPNHGSSNMASLHRRFGRRLTKSLIAALLVATPIAVLSVSISQDAGADVTPPTWTVSENLPPTLTPNAVSCPSTTTCYATGSGTNSGILVTANAGAGWTFEATPQGANQLTSISCPTVTTCFAGGGAIDNGGLIIETTDSGASWSTLTLPYSVAEAESYDIYDIAGIDCPDVNTCFATVGLGDGAVLMTVDGGTTWSLDVLPGSWDISGISCPDDQTCYIAGNGPTDVGSVIATTDGGSTWVNESQSLPHQGGNYDLLSAISCPSDLVCFATGEQNMVATTDGGQTWSFQPVPEPTSNIYALACPDSSTCFATSVTDGSIAILNTVDGGTQWSLQTTFSQPNTYFGISCPSSVACVSVSSSYSASTQDAGATWSTGPLPPGTSGSNAISCPSINVCFASTALGVISTTDGGSTWSSQTLPSNVWPNEGGDVEGISCPSTQTCVVAHGAESLFVTNDGGSTWTSTTLTGGGDISRVDCPTALTCYAFSVNNDPHSIYVTTDRGDRLDGFDRCVAASGPNGLPVIVDLLRRLRGRGRANDQWWE